MKDLTSKFTDSTGRARTRSLFVETFDESLRAKGMEPIYTLRGKEGFIDIKELYLSCDDPTEYEFAKRAFGSWKHFQHMASLLWFKEYLQDWRDELEIKMRSQAIRSLMDVAANEGSRGITAAKYIAEQGWIKQRGRPSKKEVERQKKIAAGVDQDVADDAKRLGIH